jgi:IS5 family transposase
VIEAKQSRPRKNKHKEPTQDPEAAYNVKVAADGKRKSTYGYKLHVNTDEDGFIKTMTYTAGNVHDSQEFDKLLTGKEIGVYADSAYASKKNAKKLGKGKNKIMHRAYRNKPLTDSQKRENKKHSKVRFVVEQTFGLLKLHHGLGKARYLGLKRNEARAQLIAMSHNIKRGMSILKQMRSLEYQCA